jgi:uncharacterized protein YlxW (UPF0749 family)
LEFEKQKNSTLREENQTRLELDLELQKSKVKENDENKINDLQSKIDTLTLKSNEDKSMIEKTLFRKKCFLLKLSSYICQGEGVEYDLLFSSVNKRSGETEHERISFLNLADEDCGIILDRR